MKKFYRGAVGTGSGTLLYTTPNEFRSLVQDINIANTTASPITFKLHIVDSGGSPSTSNQMIPTVTVPGYTFVQWTGQQRMNAGDFLQGIASASGITVMITGDEAR